MTAKMVGTCEACQGNKHDKCANQLVCICALRGHPMIRQIQIQANLYRPNPESA